jgi:hypothetical protein
MRRLHVHEYEDCGKQAPFVLPLPGFLSPQAWPLISWMVLFRGLTPLLDRKGVSVHNKVIVGPVRQPDRYLSPFFVCCPFADCRAHRLSQHAAELPVVGRICNCRIRSMRLRVFDQAPALYSGLPRGGGAMDEQLETRAVQLAAIDRATLTPLVQSALNSEAFEVTHCDREQLHGGAGAGNAVYRFSGQGREQERKNSWSLILKTIQPVGGGTQVSAWNYYRREPDAYQSGWLDDLPGGLAAPRCFGVVEHPDDTCWIWLEDVADEVGSHWPLEQYGVVARHVGQFNGAYLVDRPMPSWTWLSSGWWRKYIAESAPAIPLIRDSLDHPLVRRGWPGDASARLFRLWEERNLHLDALDRLPQTLCHLDLFRRNLFARKTVDGDDQTIVIDWSYTGRGAIGQELASLVLAGVAFNEVDFSQAQALEDIVFEGYLEGLHQAGWRGDPRQVRLGYTAASLRYRFAELGDAMSLLLDESQHAWAERVFGRPVEEVQDHWAQVGNLVDSLTAEARELMDILG